MDGFVRGRVVIIKKAGGTMWCRVLSPTIPFYVEHYTHSGKCAKFIEDLKKKIKAIEKELETIASTVKNLSVFFPLIGQKEKEKKQLLLQL